MNTSNTLNNQNAYSSNYTRFGDFNIAAVNLFLDNFNAVQLPVETTIVDKDILINTNKTQFTSKMNVLFDNDINIDLNVVGYFMQIDDEWSGVVIDHITRLNSMDLTIPVDLTFRQQLQGSLLTNPAFIAALRDKIDAS